MPQVVVRQAMTSQYQIQVTIKVYY